MIGYLILNFNCSSFAKDLKNWRVSWFRLDSNCVHFSTMSSASLGLSLKQFKIEYQNWKRCLILHDQNQILGQKKHWFNFNFMDSEVKRFAAMVGQLVHFYFWVAERWTQLVLVKHWSFRTLVGLVAFRKFILN